MTDPLPTEGTDGDAPPAPAPISRTRGAIVLAALLMGLLLGALDNFVVATVLPKIATDLNDYSGQVFVVSSYLIAQTVAIPIFGKLSDRFGRRSFYLLGLAIFLVGSALSGLSQNLNELIAFRAIQGVGSGAFFTVVFSIVADLFPPKEAARLVGILSGVFGIAIVFGPLLGSYIVDTTTWRWIFFVNLPIGFAAIALVLATFGPMRPTTRPRAFDLLGAGLLSVWVGALIFALVEASNGWSWTDPRTLGLLAVAFVLCPLFLWQETRADDPLIPLKYFRIPLVSAASGVNFLRGAILTVVVTYVSIFVIQGLGGSVDQSRDVLYGFMVPMIVGAALGGQLVAKFGYRLPTSVGLALTTVGCLLLTLVPTTPPVFRFADVIVPLGIVGALMPLGFGVGMTFAPTQLAIQYSVPKGDVGTANSLVWFLSNLGGSIVVSLLASYQISQFKSLVTSVGPTQAFATSIHDMWPFVVAVSVVGLLFALYVRGALPGSAEERAEGPTSPVETPVAA